MIITIKIGGSLIKKGVIRLAKICKIIQGLSKKYKIIIIAGGGQIADNIRTLQRQLKFSENTAHWLAIMAMDINSVILTEMNKKFKQVETIKECKKISQSRFIPVFTPFKLLKKIDVLPKTWQVTSDSIALFISHIFNSDFTILLKDVNGIYKNFKRQRKNIIRTISSKEIKYLQDTCVDKYLPNLISRYKKEVYVVSGLYPGRIKKILKGENVLFTRIIP